MTFPWPWLCQWTLDVQAAIIHPSASPQTLTAEAQIEKLKSSIQLLGKAPGEGWLVMPVISDTHIYRSVGWEAEEFEKLVSDQQKDRSKTELEKIFFAFPTDFIYILCILSSLKFHLVVFISKQQAATRTWWASTEPWQRRPRFVRRKTPWPSRTTVIHKRGKGWSQIFKRNMST